MEGTIIMNSPDISLAFKCQVIWKEKPKGFSATSSYVEKGRKIYLSGKKENGSDARILIIVYRKVIMFYLIIDCAEQIEKMRQLFVKC